MNLSMLRSSELHGSSIGEDVFVASESKALRTRARVWTSYVGESIGQDSGSRAREDAASLDNLGKAFGKRLRPRRAACPAVLESPGVLDAPPASVAGAFDFESSVSAVELSA